LGGCFGTITSLGLNLDRTNTCSFTGGGDLVNTHPNLAGLAANGGPTLTHAPVAGSPAIDSGPLGGFPLTDQRGVVRPVDGNADGNAVSDRGAVEAPHPGTCAPVAAASGAMTPASVAAVLALYGVVGVAISRRRLRP